jgi:hexosaminidase
MIIPRPSIYTARDGAFAFPPRLTVFLAFGSDPGNAYGVADEIAQQLRVSAGCFVTVKTASPGEADRGVVVLTDHDTPEDLGGEGYELDITPDRITLRAAPGAGLFYAAKSFGQLLGGQRAAAGDNGSAYLRQLPCATIKDRPRFAWRGFMLDSARHFQPIELIFELIDRLAALKLNRFHWHLTDDQGWRLEVLGFPALTSVGAWRSNGQVQGGSRGDLGDRGDLGNRGRYGGYYTQEQVRDVVTYAGQRHITVVPEIEMPGHNLAALASYPQLSCHGGPLQVPGGWGVLDGVFCAGREQTFAFLQNVLDEVAELFPGPYLHVGGDERKRGLWDHCPRCLGVREKHGLADESALQRWFMGRVTDHVHTALGRRSIAWGDNIDAGGIQGQVVHGWLPEQSAKSARQGLDTINSTHQWVYLDYPATEEELAEDKPDWMKVLPLEKVYRFDPIPPGLEPEFHPHVLGGEAPLWTEHVPTEAGLYHQLTPRLLAFSEAVWSPLQRRDFDDFKERLAIQQAHLFPG